MRSTLRLFEIRFEKYDLVIADGLGYISFDKGGSELLFTNLSLWAKRGIPIAQRLQPRLTIRKYEHGLRIHEASVGSIILLV
jgi:hypothetical protein